MKGFDNQLDMLIEECSELILAIQKHKRGKDISDIIKESADVAIVINQIKMFFQNFDEVKESKLDRFENYVIEENKTSIFPTTNIPVVAKIKGFVDNMEIFVNEKYEWCLADHYGEVVSKEDILYWSYK
jgi:NTP pyrophosphatase (non-canonical NTP hydrolase)